MDILGVSVDNLRREEILKRLAFFLHEPTFHRVATVNPEFLLLAGENQPFRQSLEEADLRLADGFGITLAFLSLGKKLYARFPGADLMEEILKIAQREELSVYLALRKDALSSLEEIRKILLKRYPHLRVHGREYESAKLDPQFLNSDPIVFCNFGIPEQEIFLAQLKNNPGNARLAMGVGGSFDYLTGKISRAPKFLRIMGHEWLWRFLLEPRYRAKRIWNAVVVFPWKVITTKKRGIS